jgi:hypothetical protein
VVSRFQVTEDGSDWADTYTVSIDGIWKGDGADIDFYEIGVQKS